MFMVRSGISMIVWVKVGSRIKVRVWTRVTVGVGLEFWLGLGFRLGLWVLDQRQGWC